MIKLIKTKELDFEKDELKGFDKNLTQIQWFLIVLVILYFEIQGSSWKTNIVILTALLIYTIIILFFHYFGLHHIYTKLKLAIETWIMISFITIIIWYTGKILSPLISLYFLVIITAAITLGKRITFLEVGLISTCCLFLSFPPTEILKLTFGQIGQLLISILPFWLVAYLSTILSEEKEIAKKKIKKLAQTDDLTGLKNMRMFSYLAENEMSRCMRYRHSFSIIIIDVDNLKDVNDTYGHQAGNSLIIQMAEEIQKNLRILDVIARYGGDEFIALLPETGSQAAGYAGERIRKSVENNTLEIEGRKVGVTVSIGIAGFPEHGNEIQEVMSKADQAMYYSKANGKNRSTTFSVSMTEK